MLHNRKQEGNTLAESLLRTNQSTLEGLVETIMVYTATNQATTWNPQTVDVPSVTAQFQRLSTDDKLGLLWGIYTEVGRSITPAAPGAARLQFAEGILNQIKQMPQNEQLEVMRDLVKKVSTPITRAYGSLTNNTKLAFWYQLAQLMKAGVVIPVPPNYQLSREANAVFVGLQNLSFNQQITVLRNAVADMGVDPLA